MRKLAYGLAGAVLTPWLSLVACGTDNGPNVYGEQYGPNSKVDARADDVTPVPGEPGPDAGESDAPLDVAQPPACVGSGTIAVLAGDDTSLTGAFKVDGGAWSGAAIAGGAAKSLPALVAFGSGFAGVTRGPGDVLQGVPFTTSFGAAAAIGTATSLDAPSLAVIGTTAHVAYLSGGSAGIVNKFFHGTNGGSGWDAANDPVKPAAGAQSFGPSGPAIASAGTELVFANDGQDNGLYVQVLAGGAWSAASAVSGAGTHKPAPPAMVSTGGGTFDVVVLWVDKDTRRISFAPRNATTKTWGAAAVIDTLATTDEHLAVARVSSSTILVAFRGQDLKGYVSTGTIGAASITWTAAVPVTPGGALVDSAPSIAKGICGDDAIAVFASSSQVRATRLRSGAWSAPEAVTGASGSRVAVATR